MPWGVDPRAPILETLQLGCACGAEILGNYSWAGQRRPSLCSRRTTEDRSAHRAGYAAASAGSESHTYCLPSSPSLSTHVSGNTAPMLSTAGGFASLSSRLQTRRHRLRWRGAG